MGKSTISMAIFNSYVSLPEGKLYVGESQILRHFIHLGINPERLPTPSTLAICPTHIKTP